MQLRFKFSHNSCSRIYYSLVSMITGLGRSGIIVIDTPGTINLFTFDVFWNGSLPFQLFFVLPLSIILSCVFNVDLVIFFPLKQRSFYPTWYPLIDFISAFSLFVVQHFQETSSLLSLVPHFPYESLLQSDLCTQNPDW